MLRNLTFLPACLMALASPAVASAQTAAMAATHTEMKTIEALADRLASDFVYPEVGLRYSAMLRQGSSTGRYAGLTGRALAERLTADLQAVQADGHLRVRKMAENEEASRLPPDASGEKLPDIEQAQWLAPGIAFVRFNLFPADPAMLAATTKFLSDHASAKIMIFDIRTHRGGTTMPIDEIFSRLYEKPTRLATMSMRRSVEDAMRGPVQDGDKDAPQGPPSLKPIAGTPQESMREHWSMPKGDTRLHNARVYVLTSPRTASAAEHFAFALKLTGRATLVGSATAGANHFGGEQTLPGGYAVFVPFGRTFDPKTGADWEGKGVTPNVRVQPEGALVRVLEKEGLSQGHAQRLSARVAPRGSMLPRN